MQYRPRRDPYNAHQGGSTMAMDSHAITGLTGSTSIGKACLFTFVRLDVHVLYTCCMRLDSDVYYIYNAGGHVVPRYAFTRRVSEHWRVRYTFDWYNAHWKRKHSGNRLARWHRVSRLGPIDITCLFNICAKECACFICCLLLDSDVGFVYYALAIVLRMSLYAASAIMGLSSILGRATTLYR